MTVTPRRRGRRFLALFLALAFIAAACGDDSGGNSDGGDGGGNETAEQTTTTNVEEIEEAVEGGDATGADERETESGPVHGGTLVYGIEADSSNPWTPWGTSCAISCRMILRTISDSLFITNQDGELVPYLVDTVTPSDDFTSWTVTVKDGIFFHDGTPLDGAAVKLNVDACKVSGLTATAFAFLESTTAEGQSVTFNYSQPDVLGPTTLRAEVCGLMFSPTWMKTIESLPQRAIEDPENPFYDATIAETAPVDGAVSNPVGLGPFRFDSYTPGNGNSFKAVRNDDYWRGDGPSSLTDEGLPYLDAVELVVAVDIESRSRQLQTGEFNIIHTANSDEVAKFREQRDEFVLLEANDFGETSHAIINVAEGSETDPEGDNADNPLLDVRVRRAMAHAIDLERYVEERQAGIVQAANGPFPPGSAGHLEDSGYPKFDVAAGQALLTEYINDPERNDGKAVGDPVTFSFNTTNDNFNVESNELVISMWQQAFGDDIDASIMPVEQGQYIGLALVGTYDAQGWRNHAGVDPGEQWFWWISGSSTPMGELALNFNRFKDDEMDAEIITMLTNPDQEARVAAAEQINRIFGEQVYNWWLYWTLWGVIADNSVQNLTELPLPDGGTAFPVIAGKHQVAQVWCTNGECDG